ncbi:MAG TPA: DNA-3-methyladenine glycosylase [Candidatus Moranbacteria bacterium]|nr:DNA-3-methyladenine glycosylase [Candidatus Moranbacteria bacterium]HRZ33644.1 DNA-3-methyladenine glycosylase [Candidatus Moranbacteria bacterium]
MLNKNFYKRNTLKVAQDLLGCFLIRKINGKIIKAMIVETEAYMGEDDLASHASKGRTPRTELMFGEAGKAYVYMIYGMYHCLNIITEKKDFPAAVLIRSVKIEGVDYKKTNGPGKLCKILKIDRKLNGWNIIKGEKLWLEKGINIKQSQIKKEKRVGIDYAKHCKEYIWRFILE